MALEEVLTAFLAGPSVRVFLAAMAVAATASPIVQFWYDVRVLRLMRRQALALERIAAEKRDVPTDPKV